MPPVSTALWQGRGRLVLRHQEHTLFTFQHTAGHNLSNPQSLIPDRESLMVVSRGVLKSKKRMLLVT